MSQSAQRKEGQMERLCAGDIQSPVQGYRKEADQIPNEKQ
jgi:hypothetical protein